MLADEKHHGLQQWFVFFVSVSLHLHACWQLVCYYCSLVVHTLDSAINDCWSLWTLFQPASLASSSQAYLPFPAPVANSD